MAWYRAGTISVTNGSTTVSGAGTQWVDNVLPGEALVGPDSRPYEVAQIVSATELRLASPYLSGNASGQGYALVPNASYVRDLALRAAEVLGTFGAVRDGIGQGLIADGSPATPGIRFAADQDTGIFRLGQNILAIAAGGGVGAYFGAGGMTVPGTLMAEGTGGAHIVRRAGGSQGDKVIEAFAAAAFFIASGGAGSSAASAAVFATNTVTGRSINTGGTINASGADYAEYMTKADGCGTIAPGDVCGVDRDGRLTKTWAKAISHVIKSTNPSYVGGDDWAAHLPERPEQGEGETMDAYARRMGIWEAAFEVERQKVDRIAFCGQVLVNVDGPVAVGDYLVAVANGGGIKAVAVAEADITFDQYRRRLGKVWAIRDGRPWVDVQHG